MTEPHPAPNRAELQVGPATRGLQSDTHDSLQGCLLYFLRRHRLTHTLVSLTTGLPVKDNRLTPAMFTRAASRAGLVSRVVKRPLKDLSPAVLPAVILLSSGRSAVLTGRHKDEDGKETWYVLDTFKDEVTQYSLSDLEPLYGGYAILVRAGLRLEFSEDGRHPARQWFWRTLAHFKPLYAKVFMAAAIVNFMGIATSIFAMQVYDRVIPNAATATLWVLALGVLIAYIFDFIFRQLRAYFVDVAGRGADILLASRIFGHLLNIKLGQQEQSTGSFANQLREYDSLREFFTSSTVVALVDVPFLFLYVFVIWMVSGGLALVTLMAIPLLVAGAWAFQRPTRELIRQTAREMDMKHGHLIESINALENIKSIGAQSAVQGKWEELVGVGARLSTKTRFWNNLGSHLAIFLPGIANVTMVVAGVYMIMNGDITMGALIASTLLQGRALQPLGQLAGLVLRYETARSSMDTLTKFMLSPVERPAGKSFVHVKKLLGGITFADVSFAYPHTRVNSLQSISFTIQPGERVGIIGRAGSGKSTLARLVLGLYAPTQGSILLDGLEIGQLDPAEVRKHSCYFPQNLYLFRGTLRENLLLANPQASDAQLLNAVELSGAYRLLRRHPMGFDLPVGERGENLSGGQRQAVGLARAVMHDGTIAILDDPTSEMDAGSENWVKDRLSKWLAGRTLLLITHRPTMLDLVDRLLVIDDGKLIMDGPKAKVLAALQGPPKPVAPAQISTQKA